MSATICFFTDEDIYAAVAPALRRLGHDALSTPESGRRGQSDESQLEWAALHDRAIVTFNVRRGDVVGVPLLACPAVPSSPSETRGAGPAAKWASVSALAAII